MPAPTPLHRDPENDGDDFGCVGRRARSGNRAVARLVESVGAHLRAGEFTEAIDVVSFVSEELEAIEDKYDCGCCDTVVKENVFAALMETMNSAGINDFDSTTIYGW